MVRALAVLLLILASCRRGKRAAPPETWPASMAEAAKQVAQRCGYPTKPLQDSLEFKLPAAPAGLAIDCEQKRAEDLLAQAHRPLRDKGLYLFLVEQAFAIGGKPDTLAILPTTDPYQVMTIVGTDAANYEKDTGALITWLRALEAEQPFELTGIGLDFLSGRFTTPIKDPAGLAARIYDFCPDIVDQGVGSVEALATELRRSRSLYFWWD
jgi:hypothetical protein